MRCRENTNKVTLKSSTSICKLANPIKSKVYNLFADGVVSTSVVVGRIFLAVYQLLRMKERTVSSGTDFIDSIRLKVQEEGTRNVFSRIRLGEEGVKRVVLGPLRAVVGYLSIGGDAVFLRDIDTIVSKTDLFFEDFV